MQKKDQVKAKEQPSAREQRKARRRLRKRFVRSAMVAGVFLIGLLVVVSLVLPSSPLGQRRPAAPSAPGTLLPDQGRDHIAEGAAHPKYNSVPPTSGWHYERWHPCGIIIDPIPDEVQVHNLEHGFVMIQYSTKDQELIKKLEGFTKRQNGYPNYLILAPYPKITSPIALTAWTALLTLDTYDEAQMQQFVDAYRGRGPEANAPGC